MSYKHLLVHVDAGARSPERIDLAVKLAARFGARLTGLFAQDDDWRSPRGKKRPSAGQDFEATAELFHAKARAAKLGHDLWKVPNGELDPGGVAARFCRYADLSILGQPDPEEPRVPADLASKVLLESGRPLLLVPSSGHFAEVGRRVVVEWFGSRESARALADALPLMRGAQAVHVLDLRARHGVEDDDEPAHEVVRHLASHGIVAQADPTYLAVREARRSGLAVLDLLLNRSADFGADLVVMGARGKHGVPFPKVGRTTRRSLDEVTAPVLLSH
jgi:nucleotide-binding universal stress UspA family protein